MHLPSVLPMRPHYVEKLWGGDRIARLPAKGRPRHRPPEGVRVGESWEVADLPEGTTVVDDGPLEGWTLRAVVEQFGARVTGGPKRFPLLVKLVDAGDDLSIQVHPDDGWAKTHAGHFAKDEAWLVVDAQPGARVLHGFREGTDASRFRRAIAEGTADQLLREVRVKSGDMLRIKPGTMHSVGRGCLLLEVQEPSDTTFRVFDYGRRDKDGRERPLHVEEAMAVARFGPQDPPFVEGVKGDKFTLEVVTLSDRVSVRAPLRRGRATVVFVLDGEAHFDDCHLPAGASCVIPAALSGDVRVDGNATIVVMTDGQAR